MNSNKVYFVYGDNLIEQCNRLPAVLGRASLVHNLIASYKLFKHIKVINPSLASYNELKEFHSELYLDHLKTLQTIDTDYITNTQDEEYGLGYDCYPVSQMFELISVIAGASITAAKSLVLGMADVAINWCGGWHHANRDGAEGFCYINDIVLAIETLRRKFPKVLYIDLDVHHGNGVQDAYNLSDSVFTLSYHKFEPGFYPGTGGLDEIGNFSGTGFCCNVPLLEGYTDATLEYAFQKVFSEVCSRFKPHAIVVQCGADALARDPNGGANLTIKGYSDCLKVILDTKKPTLLLGGGGYNHANTARLWTSLTAQIANIQLDNEIPEHTNWISYGPDYTLHIDASYAKDRNTREYLDNCLDKILDNLKTYLVIDKCVADQSSQNSLQFYKSKRLQIEQYKIPEPDNVETKCKSQQDAPGCDQSKSSCVYDFAD